MLKKMWAAKKTIILVIILITLISVECVVLLIVHNSEKSKNDILVREELRSQERRFFDVLEDSLKSFEYVTYLGLSIAPVANVTSLSTFVHLLSLDKFPFETFINEYKLVPVISDADRVTYEEFASENIKPSFKMQNTIFSENGTQFVPAPTAEYYCPLSLIAPNQTAELFDFLGVDLCKTITWKQMVTSLLLTRNQTKAIKVFPRFVVRTNQVIIDIGAAYWDETRDYPIAMSINSFFLRDVLKQISDRVFNVEFDDDVYIKVFQTDLQEAVLNPSMDDDVVTTEKSYVYNLTNTQSWELTFFYKRKIVADLTDDSELTLLFLFLAVFLTVDLSIVIIFVTYKRFKDLNVQKLNKVKAIEKSKLLSYVNHEVRNPLNGMMGILQVLQLELDKLFLDQKQNYKKAEACIGLFNSGEDFLPVLHELKNSLSAIPREADATLSNISTCLKSAHLIKHIVGDVLDITKIEDNKLELSIDQLDMIEFAADFTKMIRPKLEEHPSVKFEFDVQVDTVSGDYFRLQQLLWNLVGNSIKFTDEGLIVVTCKKVDSGVVKIEVKDTGRGIAHSKRDNIFKAFYQIQFEDSTKHDGYGLGLFLCKLIVELMQGEIDFHSELGKGTTFWFTIPNQKGESSAHDFEEVV